MKKGYLSKVLFSVGFVILIGIGAVLYDRYINNSKEVVDVKGESVSYGIPYIVSLAPVVAREGSLYEYNLRVVDNDTAVEDLSVDYLSGPSWLSLDDFLLSGEVPSGLDGSYEVVLRVSDGYNSSTQEFYILVERDE